MNMKRHSLPVLVGVIAVMALLAACGDNGFPAIGGSGAATARANGNPQPVANGNMDSCALVTQAEAEAALDAKVGPATGGKGQDCEYTSQGDLIPSTITIQLSAGSVDDFNMIKKMTGGFGGAVATMVPGLDTAAPSILGDMGSTETIPGLGDDAFWNNGLNNIWVLKGNREFSIQILKAAPIGNISMVPYKTTAVALAQLAVARLTGAPLPAVTIAAPPMPTQVPEIQTVIGMMTEVPATIDQAVQTAEAEMGSQADATETPAP